MATDEEIQTIIDGHVNAGKTFDQDDMRLAMTRLAQFMSHSSPGDMFLKMFQQQRENQVKYGRKSGYIHQPWDGNFPIQFDDQDHMTEEVEYWSKCAARELEEAIDWFPWKRWSKQPGNKAIPTEELWTEEHIREARMEYVDAFHFFMNGMFELAMTPEMLFEMYFEKNKINAERRENDKY